MFYVQVSTVNKIGGREGIFLSFFLLHIYRNQICDFQWSGIVR